MGEVIRASASIADIERDVRKTYKNALPRGGDIEANAKRRLEQPIAAIDVNKAVLKAASETVGTAFGALMAVDGKSDQTIGEVRDAMWNALDRPRNHPTMDRVFPGGMGTYTDGAPRDQALLMRLLVSRIKADNEAKWVQDARDGWAAQVQALVPEHERVANVLVEAEATETVAEAGYRATVRSALRGVVAFKRDLKSLSFTESQIHEIIPDAD